MSSAPTELARPIEIGSLWYCHGSPVKTFRRQYVIITGSLGEDSQGNVCWKVYVTPKMIFVSLYEINLNNHFVRVD